MICHITVRHTHSHIHTHTKDKDIWQGNKKNNSHENGLIDSNIIYTIPEQHHKCQMTKMKKTVPTQNKNTEYLNQKIKN